MDLWAADGRRDGLSGGRAATERGDHLRMFHLTVQEIQLLLSSKHSGVPRYSQEIIFFKKRPWHDCIMVGMATHQPFPVLYPIPATNHSCQERNIFLPTPLLLGDPEAQPQGRGGAGCWGLAGRRLLLYNRKAVSLCPGAPAFLPGMLWCGDVTSQYRSHFEEREAVASQGFWLRPCHRGPAEPPWNHLPCPEINTWMDVSMVEATASWAFCYLQMNVPWTDNGVNLRM